MVQLADHTELSRQINLKENVVQYHVKTDIYEEWIVDDLNTVYMHIRFPNICSSRHSRTDKFYQKHYRVFCSYDHDFKNIKDDIRLFPKITSYY